MVRDIIKYTKEKKKSYLLQIDQEKAFGKIDRPLPFETMEKLGFSKNYIEFIEISYKDNKSIITNNRFLSESVSLFRGLKQRCPLSLPLYVVQGEITSENINNNTTIIGITIPNTKKQVKISQYANDSYFFSTKSRVYKKCLKILSKIKGSYRSNNKL